MDSFDHIKAMDYYSNRNNPYKDEEERENEETEENFYFTKSKNSGSCEINNKNKG